MSSKQEETRKEVVRKYCENRDISFKTLANFCKTSLSTIKRTIKKFVDSGETARKVRSGGNRKLDKIAAK